MLRFAFVGEDQETFLSNFLINENFELMRIENLLKIKENRMIIIDYKTSLSKIQELARFCKNITPTIFLLPKTRKAIKLNDNIICVFYPIKINDFKKTLHKQINDLKISFQDIFLDQKGLLINIQSTLKIYLTETEQNILRFLISKHSASKKDLKKEILNLNPLVDTRSLESHLSRIRKKIKKIDSVIKIISINQDNIKII